MNFLLEVEMIISDRPILGCLIDVGDVAVMQLTSNNVCFSSALEHTVAKKIPHNVNVFDHIVGFQEVKP